MSSAVLIMNVDNKVEHPTVVHLYLLCKVFGWQPNSTDSPRVCFIQSRTIKYWCFVEKVIFTDSADLATRWWHRPQQDSSLDCFFTQAGAVALGHGGYRLRQCQGLLRALQGLLMGAQGRACLSAPARRWATHPSGTTLGLVPWVGWAWRGLQKGSLQGPGDWSCCGLAGAGADGPKG